MDEMVTDGTGVFERGQKVDLLIERETDLGYKAVVNGTHYGVLYWSEVFQRLDPGQALAGYIAKVREDGRLDLSIYPPGRAKVLDLSEIILQTLRIKRGFLPLHDRSAPEDIYSAFGVSKKSFKQAVGNLLRRRMIVMEEGGIRMAKD